MEMAVQQKDFLLVQSSQVIVIFYIERTKNVLHICRN